MPGQSLRAAQTRSKGSSPRPSQRARSKRRGNASVSSTSSATCIKVPVDKCVQKFKCITITVEVKIYYDRQGNVKKTTPPKSESEQTGFFEVSDSVVPGHLKIGGKDCPPREGYPGQYILKGYSRSVVYHGEINRTPDRDRSDKVPSVITERFTTQIFVPA